jgi:hypothetical protein
MPSPPAARTKGFVLITLVVALKAERKRSASDSTTC